MKQRSKSRGRAIASCVVAWLVATSTVLVSAEGQAPRSPKRGGLTSFPEVPSGKVAPVRADVEQALASIRTAGVVRSVSRDSSGRVASLFGDLGMLPSSTALKGNFASDAVAFVSSVAPLLGVSDAASELRVERRIENAFGERVTLAQMIGEYPVFDSHTNVDVTRDGRVFGLTSSFAPDLDTTLRDAIPMVDADAASAIALAALSLSPADLRSDEPIRTEIGIASADGGHLAWRLVVPQRDPVAQWEITVDALSGQVVGVPRDVALYAGRASLFVPNPIVSSGNTALKDDDNSRSAVPDSDYIAVDLLDLDSSGFVSGTFATTDRTVDRVSMPGSDFTSLRRDDRGFDEVEAYWAIDAAQRYIQNTLHIDNAANYKIRVAVHAYSYDNSDYMSNGGTGVLNFGDGGVDDSQDAEIVWHEYGHAILDNQAQIHLGSGESGAIHEGWGDYVAATMSTTVPGPAKFYPTIGEWDATSYSDASPPFLRRVDGDKQYPADLDGEVHDDGELYSACLWGIHEALGRAVADPIIFNANFLFGFDVTIPQAAAAILESDLQLNGGANAAAIQASFAAHGIVLNPTIPTISGVKIKKAKLIIDGADFVTSSAIIEVDGAAYGSLKYPAKFRRAGASQRVTSKDARVRSLPAGVPVQVAVFNPTTGARSAPFSFTP